MTRPLEKTPSEAESLADIDIARNPNEFIREIYKEAYNNQQDGHDQVAKVLMKCSALIVKITEEQSKSSEKMFRVAKFALFISMASLAVAIISIFR